MSDERTFTLTLTVAQYDLLMEGCHQIAAQWKLEGITRSSNRSTLMRSLDRIEEAWSVGTRK